MSLNGRQTKKLTEAIRTAKANGIPVSSDRDNLYNTLERHGLNWSSKNKTWDSANPYTKSPYTTPDGNPTRFCRVRIEFHADYIADETDNVCQILNSNGYRITGVSRPYANTRRDKDAMRVYITGEKRQ